MGILNRVDNLRHTSLSSIKMINKISKNISQLHFQTFGSTVYLIKLDNQNILIDTSSKENQQELIKNLKELSLSPEDINTLILTHNHYDHIGNNNLFPNATIITSNNLQELPEELKPIKTPGHTKDSICILYKNILFSGDTIFHQGGRGRTDLEGGSEQQILESIEKLKTIDYKILCPGHI